MQKATENRWTKCMDLKRDFVGKIKEKSFQICYFLYVESANLRMATVNLKFVGNLYKYIFV